MQKIFFLLRLLLIFLFLNPINVIGQDIQLVESISLDPTTEMKEIPWSFCVTEDEIFLIPDQNDGSIKLFGKEGKILKFIEEFEGSDTQEKFLNPTYCFYDQKNSQLGVFDYGLRMLFIFKRNGKIDFELIRSVPCKTLGYDMGLAGVDDNQQLVVSGYLLDEANRPFDLYGINIENGQINYLLPSNQKYNLKTIEDFNFEFKIIQTLPAIGIKAFFDIQGDDLFYVWEGALRIIKLNLRSKETMTFGHPTSYYIKPDALRLSSLYKRREFKATWNEQKSMSYIRNIFATPGHVFLVYETNNHNISNPSRFRLQIYTPGGDFLSDVSIPGNLRLPIWFDKESYELYAFAEESGNGKFSILKYKIEIKR